MENDDGMSQFGKVAIGRLRCSPKGPRTQIMGLEGPNVGPLGQDTRKPYKDCTCYLFALPQAPLARFLLVLINSWVLALLRIQVTLIGHIGIYQ